MIAAGAFLRRSITTLASQHPVAYARMCRALDGRALALRVDDEDVRLTFRSGEALFVEPDRAGPDVEVVTSRGQIFRMVDGHASLVESVMSDRLGLRGTPVDLVAFHDGLAAYLGGAVRSPGFPGLLSQYRRAGPRGGTAHAGGTEADADR